MKKISEDEENLFIGTTNLDEESEVGIESQYMVVVDEIEKCRKKNKVLKGKLSKEEEVKTLQKELRNSRQQVLSSMEEVKILKEEVVEFKEEVKKLKDQLIVC